MSPMSRDNNQPTASEPSLTSPHPPRNKPSSFRSPPPPPPGPPTNGGNNTMMISTPSRPPRNNYSDESTPIASAKRPGSKRRGLNPNSTPMDTTPLREEELSPMHCVRAVPRNSHQGEAVAANIANNLTIQPTESELSIVTERGENGNQIGMSSSNSNSWVGRKVDALFSPVLSFLNGKDNHHDSSKQGKQEEGSVKNINMDDDNDEEKSIAVSVAIRTALLEASKELNQDTYNNNHHATSTTVNASHSYEEDHGFDSMPVMTKTESTSKDADGDVVMGHYNHEDEDSDDHSDYKGHTQVLATTHDADNDEYDADEEEDFNPFSFIKSLPPYHLVLPQGWNTRPKALPPLHHTDPPICLVLDLDETLVHCTVEPIRNADMVFPVEFNGLEYTVHVRCRPYLKTFLEKVCRDFEVVVFTASQQVYADKLLDKIDPDGKYIRHRMFRDSCLPVEGNFLKDLSILGRDLRRAVLVDNSPHAFGYQVDNGIPIESWFDDVNDRELLKLERFLRTLHGKEDVRDVVRDKFRTYQLVADA